MEFVVYVLRSLKDNKRYIGFTDDLCDRINQHNSGKVPSTRNRRPLKLIYTEVYKTRKEAREREKFFKSGKGREYLKSQNL